MTNMQPFGQIPVYEDGNLTLFGKIIIKIAPIIVFNISGWVVTTLDSTNNVLCSIQTSFKFQLFGCLSIKISNYFVVESRAIAKYIAEAYTDKETNLISKDPKK